ncbi:MAG: hypothetical protein KGL74_11670 [Elusimicrobia bacterium]|nr:hypothetical protein [Elusimicrobiota bacterium]MDE2511770.1 hypothetical protein [Elusimicrobiota bacterium]
MKTLPMLLVVLIAAAAAAAPAAAGVTVGVDQTFGTSNYRGTKANASLDLTDSIYVAPSFLTYRNDQSSGSYYQGGLRVGYEVGPFSFGVQGAFVPKENGYKQNSFGADATFSLAPGGTKHGHRMAGPSSQSNETFGYGLAGVDVGVSANHITHSDDYAAAGTSGDAIRRQGALRANRFTVGQTDLTAFAGAKFLLLEVSGSISKTTYDKNLDNNMVRESPFLAMGEFTGIEAGFPDSSYNLKAKIKTLPFVRPYVSYTHTNFKLGSAPSNGVELGGVVGLDMLNVKAAYGHYGQNGFTARNYFLLGASLNF